MVNVIKKYWYFFILAIILLIIIIGNIFNHQGETKDLKKYLITQDFLDNYQNELKKEIIDKDYDLISSGSYQVEAFNYVKHQFNLINKEKIDNLENVYTITLNLLTKEFKATYNISSEYQEWFIQSNIDLNTNNYTCNTGSYKGLQDYCDELKDYMYNYKHKVQGYLDNSNTSDYYNLYK